jgi:hypothetical protein
VLEVPLKEMLPPAARKWVRPGLGFFCRSVGISIAWTLTRAIFAFHSSIRGAEIFVRAMLPHIIKGAKDQALNQHVLGVDNDGKARINNVKEDGPIFYLIVAAVASLGFCYQLRCIGWGLPFPVNILFLPFRIVEWLLTMVVAHGVHDDGQYSTEL